MEQGPDILTRLPLELSLQILGHLTITELLPLTTVSHAWHTLATHDTLSGQLLRKHYPRVFASSSAPWRPVLEQAHSLVLLLLTNSRKGRQRLIPAAQEGLHTRSAWDFTPQGKLSCTCIGGMTSNAKFAVLDIPTGCILARGPLEGYTVETANCPFYLSESYAFVPSSKTEVKVYKLSPESVDQQPDRAVISTEAAIAADKALLVAVSAERIQIYDAVKRESRFVQRTAAPCPSRIIVDASAGTFTTMPSYDRLWPALETIETYSLEDETLQGSVQFGFQKELPGSLGVLSVFPGHDFAALKGLYLIKTTFRHNTRGITNEWWDNERKEIFRQVVILPAMVDVVQVHTIDGIMLLWSMGVERRLRFLAIPVGLRETTVEIGDDAEWSNYTGRIPTHVKAVAGRIYWVDNDATAWEWRGIHDDVNRERCEGEI
jgi:hypothetical protein